MKKLAVIPIAAFLLIVSIAPGARAAALAAVSAAAAVQDPLAVFREANREYAAGNYTGAIAGYRSLLDAGFRSGNIYYNLGNAYIKSGKIGEAILHYERAKLYIPRDSDLLANYRYARSLMKQKDPAQKRHWLLVSVDIAFGYFTTKELFILTIALLYIMAALFIWSLYKPRLRPYVGPLLAILAVFLLAMIPPFIKKGIDEKEAAVVTAPIIDARYEPLQRGEVHFPLYEGMKVSILATRNDWRKIKRSDGKIGWVPANFVQPISGS